MTDDTPAALTTPDIARSRPIISADPTREVWKYLRFFLDERRGADRIRAVHGLPHGQDANVKKQARQIAQSIRQAQEYFTAAGRVSLATRPTLLYYGAVSLSRAVILLRLDGTFSYDALRAADRHAHHGLDLNKSFLSTSGATEPSNLLEGIRANAHTHQASGTPWGNYALFHQALVKPAILFRNEIAVVGGLTSETRDEVLAGVDGRELSSIVETGFSLLDLVLQMPDMWADVIELGMSSAVCPGRVKVKERHTMDDAAEPPKISRINRRWEFWIWGTRPDQIEKLRLLTELNPALSIHAESPASISFHLTDDYAPEAFKPGYVPDMVDTLTGRIFFVPYYEEFVLEPANHLAILFCLGMLARYYPDIWMSWLDDNPLFAEVLDSVLTVIDRKFPLLVLDQLTGLKHYSQPS